MLQNKAFLALKKVFTIALFLQIFNLEKLAKLETNASNKALGAVLYTQDNNSKQRVLEYYFYKFLLAKQNYNIYNKELLAIVNAFTKQRAQLIETKYKVEVYLDYQNLIYFIITKKILL